MATTQRSTVVGVFEDRQKAQQAVNELKRAGFTEDQIGIAGRDEDSSGAHDASDKGSKAAAGAATGLAAGAGLGALWGIGIVAGLLPAIGPAIAGGTLAAILSSAAAGAAAAGLAGALIGLGIPEEEAEYYDSEFRSGRIIVTVKAGDRYNEAYNIIKRHQGYDYASSLQRDKAQGTSGMHAAPATGATMHDEACETGTAHSTAGSTRSAARHDPNTVQAREEELHVQKQPVSTGEVRVRKEVTSEHKTLEVPVQKEEVVIERRDVSGHQVSSGDLKAGEEIRVPVTEEQVHVEKQPVVKEEVHVGKRKVEDTEKVSGTVRKEQIKVDKKGDVDIREQRG